MPIPAFRPLHNSTGRSKTGENVDVVYLDFAKDKVDHEVLLHKLKYLGIRNKVGLWLHNFLKNRKQKVMVKGTLKAENCGECCPSEVSD